MAYQTRILSFIAICTVVFSLEACANAKLTQERVLREVAHKRTTSENYADGFVDGSFTYNDDYRKDFNRYKIDNMYTNGWDDGYQFAEKQNRNFYLR